MHVALRILHTGQTGVERGAYRAARVSDIPIGGFCNLHRRDELGALPEHMLADLQPANRAGSRVSVLETLGLANAVVVAVPEVGSVNSVTGYVALRREIQAAGLFHRIVDPTSNLAELAEALRQLELREHRLDLLITGPRQTRWADGEALGFQIVSAVGSACVPRRRVLVVEDDRATADGLNLLLRVLGHDVVTVADGRSALERAAQLVPEIVLLDIELPDMTGYDVARQLRAGQTQPMFLAAVTGWEGARDPNFALAAGFDRHLLKPAGHERIQLLLDEAEQQLRLAS